MADNVAITEGSGRTIAADDIGAGVMAQRVKPGFGTDGSFTDVSLTNPLPVNQMGYEYETVAASQTAQALGATGGTGDFISHVLVIPATTAPGVVTLLDNATSIPIFVGGSGSVSNLAPFAIPLGMKSVSGAWKITTGANVSVIGVGDFT